MSMHLIGGGPMDTMNMDWSVYEFCGLDLGDERLNRRLVGLAETFAAQPEAPINQACADWQATKAAYAFFANPKAAPSAILLPHQARTLERIRSHSLVLLVQDTTFLTYTHHPATKGLGPIGGNQLGLVMHSTLAFTPTGLPLGILAQQTWARPCQEALAQRRTQPPITGKESYKWLAALQDTATL